MSLTDMGPLPESDHNSELQRMSIKALNGLLVVTDDLVLRDERVEDYGVDGSFEVKLSNRMTNIRAQVQMKGTDGLKKAADGSNVMKQNVDGSISLQVKSSNLNYLLNGPCPVYILYVASTQQLWFAWGRDEQKRLQSDSPEWQEQATVTIRFANKLTVESLPTIRDRILNEGRLLRQINDSLVRATVAESINVNIDLKTLTAISADKAESVLTESGMTIVAAGFPDEAIKLFNLLSPDAQRQPKFQVICGYAQYTKGRFQMALACMAEAIVRQEVLNAGDRAFLRRVKIACDHQLGYIDKDTYFSLSMKIDKEATGIDALLVQLEAVQQRFLRERDTDIRAQFHEQLRAVVFQIQKTEGAPEWLRVEANLTLLYADGTEAIAKLYHELGLAQMRRNTSQASDTAELTRATDRWQSWERDIGDLYQKACSLKHPILIGDALVTRLHVKCMLLSNQRLFVISSGKQFSLDKRTSDALASDAERAIDIYGLAGVLDGQTRARMALADLKEVGGDLDSAKAIADEVLPVAQAMGYGDLAERAQDLLRGKTTLMGAVAEIAAMDEDVSHAQSTDEQVKAFAKTIIDVMKLSDDRLPAVEHECFVSRQVAQERVNWCRHLQILQQDPQFNRLRATANPPEPNRICICKKHRRRSSIPNPHATVVIDAFKGAYCRECDCREPKRQ